MTDTATQEIASLKVMLALQQGCHDATKRELASVRAKLNRKPEVVKVNSTRFLDIAHADMVDGHQVIGLDIETGDIQLCAWRTGSIVKTAPPFTSEQVTGWWVGNHHWHPTHFIPVPQFPTE